MTLLYFGLFIWLCVVIIADYFDTTKPLITQDISYNETYKKFDLLKYRRMPIVIFYLDRSKQIKNSDIDKYVTVTFRSTSFIRDPPNSEQVKRVSNFHKMVPCSQVIDSPKGSSMLGGGSKNNRFIVEQFGLCVDLGDSEISVQGKVPDDLFSLTALSIMPCSKGPECLTSTFQEIARVSFVLSYPTVNVNFSNYEVPVSYTSSFDDFYFINPTLGQRYQAKLLENMVYNMNSFLFSGEKLADDYVTNERLQTNMMYRDPAQLTCSEQQVQTEKCQDFFMFQITSGGGLTKITRTYKGVTDTIGEIGGAREVVFVVFFYLYLNYHSRASRGILVEKVYSIKKSENRTDGKTHPSDSNSATPNLNRDPNSKTRPPASTMDSEGRLPASQKVINQAYDIIEESLDVVTMAKEINTVRFIASFLLEEYQKVLIPFISLNIDLEHKKQLEEVNSKLKAPDQKEQDLLAAISFAVDHKQLNVEEAYRKVVDSSTRLLGGPAALAPKPTDQQTELTARIDMWCMDVCKKACYNPFDYPKPLTQPKMVDLRELFKLDDSGTKPVPKSSEAVLEVHDV